MNNSLNYRGKVTVRLKNKKLYGNNKGTSNLGKLIVKALAGYDIRDSKPCLFDIEELTAKGWQSALYKRLPFTGITYYQGTPEFDPFKYYEKNEDGTYTELRTKPDDWDNKESVYYKLSPNGEYTKINHLSDKSIAKLVFNTVMIYKNKKTINLNKDSRLCLYNNNNELLAYVTSFTSNNSTTQVKELYDSVVEGTDALIDWELNFYNSNNE